MTRMRDELRALAAVGAVCACVGAAVGAYVAWLTWRAGCEPSCHPSGLVRAQLALGLAGLVPAAVLLFATVWQRKRLALVALANGVAIYAAWGLVNNLSVHGSLFGG
jgi:hypothetical protein